MENLWGLERFWGILLYLTVKALFIKIKCFIWSWTQALVEILSMESLDIIECIKTAVCLSWKATSQVLKCYSRVCWQMCLQRQGGWTGWSRGGMRIARMGLEICFLQMWLNLEFWSVILWAPFKGRQGSRCWEY